MTYHSPTIPPESLKDPDDRDGIFVMQNAARHLRAENARLRCVDLIDNPLLETLDLSACATPVHLTVRGCPKLTTVLLPVAPEGAVLHWEFGAGDSPVQVFGALASFDSCQPDGHTCQIQTDGAPYDRSLLIPSGAPQPAPADDTALVVLLGTSQEGLQSKPLISPTLRAIHLHGVGTADELDLNGPALTQAQIINLPALKHLQAGPEMSALSVTRCPELCTLTASGSVLRIHRSGKDDMDLVGVWDHAHFVAVNARLKSGLIGSTQAHNCRYIFSEAASLSNATAPLAALPTPEAIHDPYWRTTLHRWVNTTHDPSAVLSALKILHALLETGGEADDIWAMRRHLHQRHAKLAHLGTGRSALWKAPRDLAFETQQADFALWRACAAQGVEDPAYQGALKALPWVLPMAVLARAARSASSEEERQTLLTCLSASMGNMPTGSDIPAKRQEPHDQTLVGVARLIEGLLPLRTVPTVADMFWNLPAFLEKTLSAPARLSPLVALNQMGLSSAGAQLLAQARGLLKDNPDLAAKFHAAALHPPRTDLLAAIQKGHPHHAN